MPRSPADESQPSIGLDSLPPPGIPSFFPALLARLRTANPALPLDPIVLQSILLCLTAGGKNLILRTREDDVGIVLRLAVSTLTAVFGYLTHRLRIRTPTSSLHQSQTQQDFLTSLFIPSPSPSPSVQLQHPQPTPASPGRHYASPRHHRASPSPIPTVQVTPPADPSFRPLEQEQGESMVLPRALVISGLEHCEMKAQRALVRVLAEGRVVLEGAVPTPTPTPTPGKEPSRFEWEEMSEGRGDPDGVWTLPHGFMVVYVCPVDARERPGIHKTLLDRFAMSATITLHPSTRAALQSSSRTASTPTLSTSSPVVKPQQPYPTANHLSPLFSPKALTALQTLARAHTHIPPTLNFYISDLFSAARHHPLLDGTLLSARSLRDAQELIRAARVVCGEWTGAELIKTVAAADLDDADDAITEPVGDYEIDDVRMSDVKLGLLDPDAEWQSLSPSPTPSFRPSLARSAIEQTEPLAVSEADIARIVPRAISHRLRVRDGPTDEILGSAVWGAVSGAGGDEASGRTRSTVKDILVRILSEV